MALHLSTHTAFQIPACLVTSLFFLLVQTAHPACYFIIHLPSSQCHSVIYVSVVHPGLLSALFTPAFQIPDTKALSHQHGLGSRLHSAPCLLEAAGGCRQTIRKQYSDPVVAPQGGTVALRPLHSSPRLSELMQRSPLPTILGSPSRVSGYCSFGLTLQIILNHHQTICRRKGICLQNLKLLIK